MPALLACALLPVAAVAAPGDVLYSENFNDGTLAPWTTTNASRSGIGTGAWAASGSAAFTRHNTVSVTSPGFNAAVPAARLNIWVRRGSDAFSEDTDPGEDLYIEYRRADNSWGLLGSYLGSGTKGQVYADSYMLPADALHGSLGLRARQIAGSGADYDYWHFDDVVVTEVAVPPPLTVGTCDDFESGLANWTVNALTGNAGINGATSSSPTNSLFLNGGIVDVKSIVIDTTSAFLSDLTVWVRRGSDLFSEDPDFGEDLVVEYLDDLGSWVALETFTGSGTPGTIFSRTYTLPGGGRHPNFRLRFRMTGGNGLPWDFWHVDDVCFDQNLVPSLLVSKLALTLSDPFNGPTNPKAIPGATVRYTVGVSNQGPGQVDADSLVITDPVPPDAALYVDTASGDPVVFADGPVPSGLGYSFATDVSFSNQPGGGAPYNYVAVPDADGFDSAVTGFRVAPTGAMNGAVGGNVPSFNVEFRVRVQ